MKYLPENFISIGGCCLGLYILGKNRIRGPIDNVLLFSYKIIKFMLKNQYIYYLQNTPYIKQKKKKIRPNEPRVNFLFKWKIKIIHNDLRDPGYLKEIEKRMQNFTTFVKAMQKDKNKFFVFSIPYTFVKEGEEIDHRLERLIIYLNQIGLLKQTIFVGCHKPPFITYNVWWDNYLNPSLAQFFIQKYGIKYIELDNLDLSSLQGKEQAYYIFQEKVEKEILSSKTSA